MTERTCATCRWWSDYRPSGLDYGVCRRYAPRPSNGNIGQYNSGLWPDTQPADWCGEHSPKEDGQ